MKQYRYVIGYDCSMEEMIGQIVHLSEYGKYRGLLQLVEPNCEDEPIQKHLDLMEALATITIMITSSDKSEYL